MLKINEFAHVSEADQLRKPSNPVTKFDDDLRDFISDMYGAMLNAGGNSLSAIQVGDPRRIFIVLTEKCEGGTFINPRVQILTGFNVKDGVTEEEESCLSFPGKTLVVRRPSRVVIDALDSYGKPFQTGASGEVARHILHQMDLLNGIAFFDRLHRSKGGHRKPHQHRRN